MAHPPGSRATAHLRFALCAFLILLCAAVYLGTTSFVFMAERREQETETRVQLVADLLASRIANAVQLGIPLARLEGVTPLLASIREANDEILSIALSDASGQSLWSVGSPAASGTTAGRKVTAAVRIRGADIANIMVERHVDRFGDGLLETILLMFLAVLAAAMAAAEAARHALGCGSRMRDELVAAASRQAANGIFASLFVAGSRRAWDSRPQSVTTAMRLVDEQHVRVRRLIESLRQTEPNARRRRSLDQLLDQASGSDIFPASTPAVVRLYPIEAQMRWLLLLAACSAESLRVLWTPDQIGLAGWGFALAACGAGFGFRLAARFQRRPLSLVLAALVGIALVLLAHVHVTQAAVLLALRGLMGVALGLLLASAARAEKPALDGDPTWRAGQGCTPFVLAGWIIGAEWLGPVIGKLSISAFGQQAGTLLLMLPVAAALVSVLRWATTHGVWRVRDDGGAASTGGGMAVFVGPLGLRHVAGVVLGAMIAMLATAEIMPAQAYDMQAMVLLWTASGLGAVAALQALQLMKLPLRLVLALAFAGPAMFALSVLAISGMVPAAMLAAVKAVSIAMSSAAWWHLCLANAGPSRASVSDVSVPDVSAAGTEAPQSKLPQAPVSPLAGGLQAVSFFLLALGAALQSLLQLLLPAGNAVIAWGALSAVAALIVALMARRG